MKKKLLLSLFFLTGVLSFSKLPQNLIINGGLSASAYPSTDPKKVITSVAPYLNIGYGFNIYNNQKGTFNVFAVPSTDLELGAQVDQSREIGLSMYGLGLVNAEILAQYYYNHKIQFKFGAGVGLGLKGVYTHNYGTTGNNDDFSIQSSYFGVFQLPLKGYLLYDGWKLGINAGPRIDFNKDGFRPGIVSRLEIGIK